MAMRKNTIRANYVASLNPPKPAPKSKPRNLDAEVAKLHERIEQLEVDRRALQSENHVLRGEVETLKSSDESKYTLLLEKLNGLTSAFVFHMEANTLAINAVSANVANLMAKKS